MRRLVKLWGYLALILLFVHIPVLGQVSDNPTENSLQMILIVADDWSSKTALYRRYERKTLKEKWRQVGEAHPVVLGESGLGWGVGLYDVSGLPGPIKQEGDGRSPTGVFALGSVFGSEENLHALDVHMPERVLNWSTECVDDPHSKYYNKIVDRNSLIEVDWISSEKMKEVGPIYRLGIVVEYNPGAVPRAGSCIFIHIWRDSNKTTVGCTAAAENDIKNIVLWLDKGLNPIIVQLTQSFYRKFKQQWTLP